MDLHQPSLYLNRELSLLKFNQRVLAQALDETVPLLERLKFLLICSNNLDEFFEIRVAGLMHQVAFNATSIGIDGLSAAETLRLVREESQHLIEQLYQIFNQVLVPALADQHIYFIAPEACAKEQQAWIENYFQQELLPVVSLVGLDLARPFPRLVNKSLNFIVSLEGKDAFERDSGLAIVHVPRAMPRLMRLPGKKANEYHFIFLADIVRAFIERLFPGMIVTGCYPFRLTRDSDLLLDELTENLADTLKNKLMARQYGMAVRLEVAHDCPTALIDFLLKKHDLTSNEAYKVAGPVNLSRLMPLLELVDRNDLKYPPLKPRLPKQLEGKPDLFEAIREGDILLHHPYQAFAPVVDFIRQATLDPNVIAIKQILYRTGVNSLMVKALIEAARAGKEVTAVIEVRARFEEASNLELANRLQEAGALVVYGVVGYKTHAKLTLIVRREGKQMRRYCHLGTGNYHVETAKSYTDYGLLTYDQVLGSDVQSLFQQLTGMCKQIKLKKLLHAPFTLFKSLLELIETETQFAEAGKPAHIIIKINALTEGKIIRALYRAAKAGVKVELIVRGICCLRPGVKHISDNIKVYSVVGRFLEHERVYYFYHNGEEKLFCASADWMERNFFNRIEVAFPIEDKHLAKRIKTESLLEYLANHTQRFELQADGNYLCHHQGKQKSHSVQAMLVAKLAG